MKLLDKQAISTNLARQKKGQIDEGVMIAGKIDKLRQTLAELERQHVLYLQKIKEDMNPQSDALTLEISQKRDEILILERKRTKLLEPVDAEWEKVRFKEKQLEEKEGQLTLEQQKAKEVKDKYDSLIKNLSEEERDSKDTKEKLQKQTDKVIESSLGAQNTLLNAIDTEKRVLSKVKEKTALLKRKEMEVAIRERNITTKEKLLEQAEQDIINEKLRLADQRKTLERAMNKYGINNS